MFWSLDTAREIDEEFSSSRQRCKEKLEPHKSMAADARGPSVGPSGYSDSS